MTMPTLAHQYERVLKASVNAVGLKLVLKGLMACTHKESHAHTQTLKKQKKEVQSLQVNSHTRTHRRPHTHSCPANTEHSYST